MSFNEDELNKFAKATTGWFKKEARSAIIQSIRYFRPRIDKAKELAEDDKYQELTTLVNQATYLRQSALKNGANTYGHPEWAAAAVCESWLHELLSGSEESISRVEEIILGLEQRKV